jgi:hypothetical protein
LYVARICSNRCCGLSTRTSRAAARAAPSRCTWAIASTAARIHGNPRHPLQPQPQRQLFVCPARDPSLLTKWLHVSGLYTLTSYGLTPSPSPWGRGTARIGAGIGARDAARRHLEFLSQLRPTITCGDFFFVHAGVRPGVPSAEQQEITCCGFARSFCKAGTISGNSSCTATHRCAIRIAYEPCQYRHRCLCDRRPHLDDDPRTSKLGV